VKGKCIGINGLVLFLLFIVITFAGCGDQEINSKWRTQNITIDGNDSDWGSTLVYYEDINSLVGVQNDNDYLYLCLVTTDQQIQRKIFAMGLTIWFDNSGSNDKKFGIRFPLMMKDMGKNAFLPGDEQAEGRRRNPDDGREGPGDNQQPGGPPEQGKMDGMSLKNKTEIEVVDSKNEATRVPISSLNGVELKMGVKDYRMVYELKMPIAMKKGFSYALGANLKSIISIGLETGTIEMKRNKVLPDKSGDEPPSEGITGSAGGGGGEMSGESGGEGGMRGGGRGRGGRGGADFNRSSMQALKFWAEVKLNSGSN
jgi:hypothetical protein